MKVRPSRITTTKIAYTFYEAENSLEKLAMTGCRIMKCRIQYGRRVGQVCTRLVCKVPYVAYMYLIVFLEVETDFIIIPGRVALLIHI